LVNWLCFRAEEDMAYLLTHTNMKIKREGEKKKSGSAHGGGAAVGGEAVFRPGAAGFLVLMILFGMFGFVPPKAFAAGCGFGGD